MSNDPTLNQACLIVIVWMVVGFCAGILMIWTLERALYGLELLISWCYSKTRRRK